MVTNCIEDYDSEPVKYCSKCHSLKIKYEEDFDTEYCAECGGTDIKECSIEEWESLYEKRNKSKYTEKNKDPRQSPVYRLSLKGLMHKVSDSKHWESIIEGIFPHFPKGPNKADSIIAFFDILVRKNKLDDLRKLLYKLKL